MQGRLAGAAALCAVFVLAALAGCGSEEAGPTTSVPTASEQDDGDGGGRPAEPPPLGDGDGGVALEEIGEFDQPVFVAEAPWDRGHLYVVEQCGTIQRVPRGGGEAQAFMDIRDEVTCGGEQGLLSVAFDPDSEDRLLYVYYVDRVGDQRIVEYRASGGSEPVAIADSARELLHIEDFAANHNGGLLLFGPDGNLLIGTGDGGGGGDPERTAQDLDSLLGKILRIDPGPNGGRPYSIPAGNPFADSGSGRPEILAYGLRNPWRFSFDRRRGDLWIGDVGQDELEEIDVAEADRLDGDRLNFGWSAYEGDRRFNEDQEAPGAIGPTLEYGHEGGCSVTGGYVVRDPELASLYGRYLYGDFCEGELRSFIADPKSPARDDRPLGVHVPSLSSFAEDRAGAIYAISLDGPVFRLVPTG